MRKQTRFSVQRLCLCGLASAVIACASLILLPVPMLHGYAHLGDAAVYLSAALLGSVAAVPAALGSFLADVISGFAEYAPFTLVIKSVMGFAAGKLLKGADLSPRALLILALLSMFMIAAYFGADVLLFGSAAALGSLPGNLIQAAVSLLLGSALFALPKPKLTGRNRHDG